VVMATAVMAMAATAIAATATAMGTMATETASRISPPYADADAWRLSVLHSGAEFDVDVIVGLDFEIEAIRRPDFDGAPLQRTAAMGIAGRFAEAA
jgi:hypothetical protein